MQIRHRSGFTLIELLVVIAIIGLLATLAVVSFGNARTKARDVARMANKKQLIKSLQLFYDDNRRLPTSATAGAAWSCIGPTSDSCWRGALNGLDTLVTDLSPYLKVSTIKNNATPGTYAYNDMLYITNCAAGSCGTLAGTYIVWIQETNMDETKCPAPSLIQHLDAYWYCNEYLTNQIN